MDTILTGFAHYVADSDSPRGHDSKGLSYRCSNPLRNGLAHYTGTRRYPIDKVPDGILGGSGF
jgi:hypothetical protein